MIKARFHKFSNSLYLAIFLEMHNLEIIWLYSFQVVTCKIVSLYLVSVLGHRIGILLAYVALLIMASFWGI